MWRRRIERLGREIREEEARAARESIVLEDEVPPALTWMSRFYGYPTRFFQGRVLCPGKHGARGRGRFSRFRSLHHPTLDFAVSWVYTKLVSGPCSRVE